jgi:hypothetical protein
LAGENIVRKPDDWSTYPSGNFGGLPPTLRSYTDGKLNEVQEGIQPYMKLRDYSVDASGNRSGETRIEFLRTTPVEAFGSNECVDWKIGATSACGFEVYRKGTHPTLGNIYDGNVIEFDQDGDVNIPKVGGLKINGNEVPTKSYTDTTFAAISVEQSVSDLSTTSSSHGLRLTSIEDAGYATTSQLSIYATTSSLGTTNDTVGGINTRVNTLENAGYVTSAGLGGYNFATQGYVQDNLPDVSNFVTSSTLSTNHYTKTETDTAIPDVSNFVTSSTLTTNHYTKSETDTAIPDVSNFVTSSTLTTNHYTKSETDTAITNAGGGGCLDSNGVLSINKDGEVANFQPATSGEYTLVNFNSKANSGSDKGFILVQDESAQSPGTSTEDLRMTIGVHNDFKQSTSHSDELWLQGGGRLCYNVGSWDSELNTIIGTPGVGSSHGGVFHEWRLSNATKMILNGDGLYLNSGWLRTYGSEGWYNETYGGGWHMTDSTYVRAYNSKGIHTAGNIKLEGSGNQIYLDTGGSGLYWGSGYSRIVDDGDLRICTDDNLHFNTGCNSSSLGTERMVLKANGNFGINTTAPGRTLDVNGTCDIANLLRVYGGSQIRGSESTVNYTNAQSDYLTNGGNVQVDPPSLMFGLYVQYSIRGSGIVVFSDTRIKSNVVDINDTTALDQVRLLKPKYYEYVDKVTRGSSSVIGFLAQDVKEVLPRAVSVADGEIPNIYEMATISSNNTVTFTNFNTSNLEGTNCTLIAYLAKDERKEIHITEVVDEHTVRVEEDMSEWGGQLFVWGQTVDDFHHLNKDYIWTVATAALQELDRQLQAERGRNDSLEARILALENK